MRSARLRSTFTLAVLLAPLLAFAGNQAEEQLADSVRAQLQASIADRAAPFLNFKSGPENGHKWLF